MSMPLEGYEWTPQVESYNARPDQRLHGGVHVRPVPGRPFSPDLRVECSKKLSDTKYYPVGTRFRMWAKPTDREGGGQFVYSRFRWKYDVLTKPR
jgi:hypothetical protein